MASCRTLTQILVIIVSLLLLLLLTKPNINTEAAAETNFSSGVIGNGNGNGSCIESERNALLEFRKGLKDSSGWLSSWIGLDCCNWTGVTCSNKTGNVIKLHLNSYDVCSPFGISEAADNQSCLGGTLSPSLLNLTYLSYLDMSGNNFGGNSIPEFIGSLKNLRYLDLSEASFNGKLPSTLGNLSNLEYLDLSMNLRYPFQLWASDLNWLSALSSLRYLDLSNVNLTKAEPTNWLQYVNMLPTLKELHLSGCGLNGIPESLTYVNFTSLEVLALDDNNFSSSSIPGWLSNISTLTYIFLSSCELKGSIPKVSRGSLCNLRTWDLSYNKINGEITELIEALTGCSNNTLDYLDLSSNNLEGNLPESFGLLKYLETLRLDYNSFSGSLPRSIGNLSSMEALDLSFNKMNGTILESIGQLTRLFQLDLYGNSWEGIMSEDHFQNLSRLRDFSISSIGQSVKFKLRPDWLPPFKLINIAISGCQLGPGFPPWLRNQVGVFHLTLSSVGISDTIPDWFWNLSSQLWWIDLSNNQLRGQLPSSVSFGYGIGAWINLGSNLLKGSIPLWPNVTELSLRNNSLSGPIPSNIGQAMPNMRNLDLSRNFLNGSIPDSFNNMGNLSFLDLSSNNLSGSIPSQWQGLKRLIILDLSHNNLSGSVPTSLCSSLPSLIFLKLSSNNLSGDISTFNCSGLLSLDLGQNRFSGTISALVLDSRLFLSYLGLGGHMLTGSIPEQLCKFTGLHIIDLSHNNLSGTIPECLGSLEAFTYLGPYYNTLFFTKGISFSQHIEIVSKGRQNEYSKIIPLVNVIDLSSNDLVGEIPDHLTKLSALVTLNLSRNYLTGKIPESIGNLRRLETLDLSCNNLSGPIPLSMPSMTSLNYLNLSFNNLEGQIPRSNQFQTFNDPSIYEGNLELCGPPLPTDCSSSPSPSNGDRENNGGLEGGDRYEKLELFTSMGLGFAVGFWVVCGSLVIKRSWRQAYFKFVDEMKDRLIVVAIVGFRRINV